jgi:hypothetical protein
MTSTHNFIPLSPALMQKLRDNEIRAQAYRQGLLEGFAVAQNAGDGQWELATDGSGLVRKDSQSNS